MLGGMTSLRIALLHGVSMRVPHVYPGHCFKRIACGHLEGPDCQAGHGLVCARWCLILYGILSNGGEDNLLYPEFFTPFA